MAVVVDPKDSLFWFGTSDAMPTDQYFLLAFATAGPAAAPTWEKLVEVIADRSAAIPALNKRLAESPAGIDYPRWVHHAADMGECVHRLVDEDSTCSTPEATRQWSTCVDRIEELLGSTLDATRTPWQLHIAPDVVGVPDVDGRATIVFVRFSHVLTDGLGGAALLRALFGRTPHPADAEIAAASEPHEPGAVGWRLRDVGRAFGRLVRLPSALVATAVAGRRSARSSDSEDPPTAPLRRASINTCGAGVRDVTVLPIPRRISASQRFTVTQLALCAASLATERLLIRRGEAPDSLAAAVPVAVREGAQWLGDNRFATAVVGLGVASSTALDRAEAIRSSLGAERRRLVSPDTITMLRLVESVPWPILSRYLRRGRARGVRTEFVPAHMSVTSVNCGDADMELSGAPAVMVAGFPCLSPDIGIGLGIYGLGTTVTLGVLTSPDAVPDADEYVDLLRSALDELSMTVA
ncbi:wax ester/triacylglycerol synthase domain-containing protein [Williamsia sp. Leaf354]|uniref:wax ester/triacylglycerol synthase domain-containing protein n=1 Tax=Williamsia sp. Leaf354 TaxID=1736349 RepID=UPI002285B241|nr:wax ester/triacylglycerol synthase domain-containing protein [Williamsia sp. Leaf354]